MCGFPPGMEASSSTPTRAGEVSSCPEPPPIGCSWRSARPVTSSRLNSAPAWKSPRRPHSRLPSATARARDNPGQAAADSRVAGPGRWVSGRAVVRRRGLDLGFPRPPPDQTAARLVSAGQRPHRAVGVQARAPTAAGRPTFPASASGLRAKICPCFSIPARRPI